MHNSLNKFFRCVNEDLFHFFSVDRNKYQIHIPLPPKIDPTVTMMQVRNCGRKRNGMTLNCIHLKILELLTNEMLI